MGIFEEIKNTVTAKEIVERYHAPLNRANKVCCPFHQEKTPSLSVDTKENMWKCFGCGVGGDGIRFLAKLKGIEDFEAAKIIVQDFNLNINFETEFSKTPAGELRTYIKEAQSHIDETDYFQKRGLTAATIKTFGLGYDPKERAAVIPYSPSLVYYQLRYLKDRRFNKPKSEQYGAEPLWHPEFLERKDKTPIFVVESPICAMSIAQYGGTAVALCGTSNVKKFMEGLKKRKPNGALIICMDNDEPGKAAEKEFVAALKDAKVKHLVFNVAGNCNDPNELLLKSADSLLRNIREAVRQAFPLTRERTDMISARDLMKLKIPPKTWLIDNLLPVGLQMLVAGSKVGKSWMCLQIGTAIATGERFLDEKCNKYDVLYYALEDDDERLQYRFRVIFGDKPPPANFYILQGCKKVDNGLIEEMEARLKANPNLKLIIIDTFQMVRGQALKTESTYTYDYRELVVFRTFAAENHISVLLIHHTRKMLDENDIFNMTTGSTGIMGAVDNMFFIFKKKRMGNEPSIFSQTGRDVKQMERIIEKGEEDGTWRKLGTPEEEDRRVEREKYEGSIVVKTLRAIFKKYPNGWNGTTRDLMYAADDLFGNSIIREEDFGREIRRVEYQLRQQDGIDHKSSHKKKGTWHEFFPKRKFDLFNYQKQDYDD